MYFKEVKLKIKQKTSTLSEMINLFQRTGATTVPPQIHVAYGQLQSFLSISDDLGYPRHVHGDILRSTLTQYKFLSKPPKIFKIVA
jgi:hypothetical protein